MAQSLDIFRSLADPTRLRIVGLMRAMELSIGELAQVLGQSQPRVSRHVKILCDSGIAERRKEGSWVFLRPGNGKITTPLFSALDSWTEGDHWAVADAAKLAAVRADRATAAQTYFAAHAGQWDALRSLHSTDSEVESTILAVLGKAPIGRLVDVGTGTGRMIELFAKNCTHALGIDRSPEMLRLARTKLADIAGLALDLRKGDINELDLPDQSADTAILHQVLHYIPAPELAIAKVGQLLVPGGRLLIVDFAPHDREELRTRDAHARLGFSDEQIASWCDLAGLQLTQTRDLTGGELTVKVWCATRTSQPMLKVVGS
jgi:ubiquinone/menaquinone biosynthesis C-methylase UbiE